MGNTSFYAMVRNVFLFALPWIALTYDNIALYKNAWQLYPYDNPDFRDSVNASKAVDGLKTNLSFFGFQCTVSANFKYDAFLRVDLGAILGIHHITLYYRTDNEPWGPHHAYVSRFLGFSLYISNTTRKQDGVPCFKDEYFTKYTIPAVITLNCTHHGRYVIYYNNRTSYIKPADYSTHAFNELCEFEVYGCSSGRHGENCSRPCPDHCLDNSCHIETGLCFGCKEGYLGVTCEKQCNDGTFGKNCDSACGNCQDGKICDKETGACQSGCQSGYKGIHCKQTCQTVYHGPHCDVICNSSCPNQMCYSEKEDCLQENANNSGKQDCENTMVCVAVGGSVGALSVVIHLVVLVITYKRKLTLYFIRKLYKHSGKKDQTTNSVFEQSKKQVNNPSGNMQGSTCTVGPSPQKSQFYMELIESHYNNTAENVYEQV